jgi:S1-C subfamily serine protease
MTQEQTPQGSATDASEPNPIGQADLDQDSAASLLTEELPVASDAAGEALIVEGPVEPVAATPWAASPPQPPSQEPPASQRRWPIWATLLVAVLLIAISSGVTYLLTSDSPADTATTGQAGNPSEAAEAPEIVPGEEPVADVADLILPSVVQIQTPGGVGSGVVYDSDGLILTAAHVVAGSDTVTVRFNDGEEIEGTVLGGTSGADVAVVQVDRSGLTAADLALDEDARVGQLAVAVGSPWGLQGTVTAGIISAVNQSIPSGDTARSVIQTDAAINPGNSGGPLVDREGRVLGINVSIFSLSGANDGVGFAVPIDVAYDIAQRLVAGESIETAFLGVIGRDADSGQAGAVITEVTPGSGADEAGIEVDDMVISIDGVTVQGIADLAAQVQTHQPGSTVEIVVVRDGQEQTLSVTFGQRSNDSG